MLKMNLYSILIFSILIFSTSAKAQNFHKSSDAPIEIVADNLKILQQENKAIFTGHVVAKQGDVNIKSEKMTVFYKKPEEKEEKKKKEANSKKNINDKQEEAGQNSIEKIIVEKNVFLSTPDETAKGRRGIYDVANRKVFLNDDVVLTRNKNVLKGDRLVYNFDTGKSEMNYIKTGKSTKNDKTQRVKALFIPEKDGNKKEK
ncbi:MAG: LptA/OstA family protein [Rickettsiales bacterium]